jgi:hypothetical protein
MAEDDEDKRAILARRQRFIAIALAGMGACSDDVFGPEPCLSPPADPEGTHVSPMVSPPPPPPQACLTPTPCLSVAPTPCLTPVPCLEPMPPDIVDTEMGETGMTEAGMDEPAPTVCLSIAPPEDPRPQPCLSIRPRPRPAPCLDFPGPERETEG